MEILDEGWAKIKLAIYEGKKIEAIKMYREYTSLSLKDAKDFIDKMEGEMREKEPERFTKPAGSSGCGAVFFYAMLETFVLSLIFYFVK